MPAPNAAVLAMIGTEALDELGNMIVEPALPVYMKDNDDATAFMVTLMTALYSVSQMFSVLALGLLSDRYGRKIVMLVSLLLAGVFYIALGFCVNVPETIAVRVLLGAVCATDAVVSAYIMDYTAGESRMQALQWKASATSLASTCGAGIGAFLYERIGWMGLCLVMSGVCTFEFLMGSCFWAFEEPVQKKQDVSGDNDKEPEKSKCRLILQYFRHPQIGPLLLYAFCQKFAFVSAFGVLVFVLQDQYDFSEGEWAHFIMIFTFLMFLFSQFAKREIEFFGETFCIMAHLCVGTFSMVWLAVATQFKWAPYVMFAFTVFCIPGNSQGIVVQARLNRVAPEEVRGEVFGLLGSSCALAQALGPPIGGWLYDQVWWWPLLLGGIGLGFCLLLLIRVSIDSNRSLQEEKDKQAPPLKRALSRQVSRIVSKIATAKNGNNADMMTGGKFSPSHSLMLTLDPETEEVYQKFLASMTNFSDLPKKSYTLNNSDLSVRLAAAEDDKIRAASIKKSHTQQ